MVFGNKNEDLMCSVDGCAVLTSRHPSETAEQKKVSRSMEDELAKVRDLFPRTVATDLQTCVIRLHIFGANL